MKMFRHALLRRNLRRVLVKIADGDSISKGIISRHRRHQPRNGLQKRGLPPVSYTPLDVYKRQALYSHIECIFQGDTDYERQ